MSHRPPPPGRSFRLVLFATFATFCTMYAPQPLLPTLAREFATDATTIAWLIGVVFVCLALAPLGYGATLRRLSAQRLMVVATTLLGVLQLAFAAAQSLPWLLGTRTAQALLYPAILTAAVTYCSRAGAPHAIARRVSVYVATTIVGGLGGRLVGGFGAGALGWRATFVALGALMLGCAVALSFAARDERVPDARGSLAAMREILAMPAFRAGFALIAGVFFVFSACLNALPFRLVELEPAISAARVSLVYLGYLVGVAIALRATTLARLAGGPLRAMRVALGAFVVGLVLMWVPETNALVAIGFLTAAGMFTVHATLSGLLNGLRPAEASLVNGLYIAVYYGAGAAGSVLPLALYECGGWSLFLVAMVITGALSMVPLAALERVARIPPLR